MKTLDAANDNLVERTREFWQARLSHNLSHEDAREIAENITGFFAILAEWSRAEMPVPANDNGKSTATGNCGEACDER
jgi:hypothetical protein